jgi:hypothetical protein
VSGAVYIFTRVGSDWTQQAFIKASNADGAQHSGDEGGDLFGTSISLTDDGTMLLVGAPGEDSISTGIDGNLSDNSFRNSGAAYLFVREGDDWNQQTYFKASNTGLVDEFGGTVALSSSGDALVIGAQREASSAVGINGTENIDSVVASGAAYYFENGMGGWHQRAFVKASLRNFGLLFSWRLALAQDGKILTGSAPSEDGGGVDSGAVFVY